MGALELLATERADAWLEYLKVTCGQKGKRYERLEPFAWARLEQRLVAIAGREAKLAVR